LEHCTSEHISWIAAYLSLPYHFNWSNFFPSLRYTDVIYRGRIICSSRNRCDIFDIRLHVFVYVVLGSSHLPKVLLNLLPRSFDKNTNLLIQNWKEERKSLKAAPPLCRELLLFLSYPWFIFVSFKQ